MPGRDPELHVATAAALPGTHNAGVPQILIVVRQSQAHSPACVTTLPCSQWEKRHRDEFSVVAETVVVTAAAKGLTLFSAKLAGCVRRRGSNLQ